MAATADMQHEIDRLLSDTANASELRAYLIAHSNLPGPRANLELIFSFARAACVRAEWIAIFETWLSSTTIPGDAAEFSSCAAAVALGALYPSLDTGTRTSVAAELRRAANDSRWRVREGVAMGLQAIGEWNTDELLSLIRSWLPTATYLERRAVAAALAHPPILKRPDVAAASLAIMADLLVAIPAVPASDRKTESFKVLKQGLSYAVSVVVAAIPAEGFALLERAIRSGDRDLVAIAKANLGKNRLLKSRAETAARLLTLI